MRLRGCFGGKMRGALRFGIVALAVLAASDEVIGQTTYQVGQYVSPAYEGWEENEDGSFSLVFGYMNGNWREQLDVGVGPDNSFSPGPADQGQPQVVRTM